MKSRILKFSCFDSSLSASFVLAALLITACDSSKPTVTSSDAKPNLVAKIEVVLNEGDPQSKSDQTASTMGGATNFKYKVEIETEHTTSDPLGAARAYAVVDGDTVSASTQDWISSPGADHAVALFAFASHSSTGNNPAKASVHVQCTWQ